MKKAIDSKKTNKKTNKVKTKEYPSHIPSGTLFYDKRGNEYLDEIDFACAKKIISKKEHYYIKMCTGGIESGFYYNPNSTYSDESREFGKNRLDGRNLYEFKKVSKDVFELYIRFLKTKNIAYLRNLERL